MCHECNYGGMLTSAQLDLTEHRLRVLEAVGGNTSPISADDIFTTLSRTTSIDRVTVYRIINLLVEKGVVERISTGGRAFYYGLAPNINHPAHPHFYCLRCGRMDCLKPASLSLDMAQFTKAFSGRIDKVEVRVDGICKVCLRDKPQKKKGISDASSGLTLK